MSLWGDGKRIGLTGTGLAQPKSGQPNNQHTAGTDAQRRETRLLAGLLYRHRHLSGQPVALQGLDHHPEEQRL